MRVAEFKKWVMEAQFAQSPKCSQVNMVAGCVTLQTLRFLTHGFTRDLMCSRAQQVGTPYLQQPSERPGQKTHLEMA